MKGLWPLAFLFLASNGYAGPPAGQTEPLTPAWQKTYKQMIKASECAYVMGTERHAYLPRLTRMSFTCDGKEKTVYQCSSMLYCTNDLAPFYIRRATCWSEDGKNCPTANVCAQSAQFDTLRKTKSDGMQMLEGSKAEDSQTTK